MLKLLLCYITLCMSSCLLYSMFGLDQSEEAGFFDFFDILFFNGDVYPEENFQKGILGATLFFLIMMFGILVCSSAASNFSRGMHSMELTRYKKYGRYFLACNLKTARDALKYTVMTALLPLGIVFANPAALTKFTSLTGDPLSNDIIGAVMYFIKFFMLIMVLELILFTITRRQGYTTALIYILIASAVLIITDWQLKTGFVTMGKTLNQLIATLFYIVIFSVLYAVFRREPRK